ncbi:MAG: head-tail connector protein [Candidatus Paceibacterota bacterium]
MASEAKSNSLTTIERVKARIVMKTSGTSFDTLLERLINSVSDFIEGATGRSFKEATYIEKYSIYKPRRFLMLNQFPVSGLTKIEYRAGSYSVPSWIEYLRDEYELEGEGKSGIVAILGTMPVGINVIRATYTAGYKIDFTAPTDITKHTLPSDLTDLCERLVIKIFKKRESWGKSSEGAQGDSVSWKDSLEEEDKRTIARYKKPPSFN